MAAQSTAWELVPRPRGVYPAGSEEHTEELLWRKANLHVSLRFTQYASAEEASDALYWDMEVLSIGFPKLRGFADEAHGHEVDNRRFFRRGSYVIYVRAPMPPPVPVPDPQGTVITAPVSPPVNGALHTWQYPPVDYAALFLAAFDRVVGTKQQK